MPGLGMRAGPRRLGKLLCFTSGRNERLRGTRYVFIAESDHLNVNFILFRFKCFVNRRDL